MKTYIICHLSIYSVWWPVLTDKTIWVAKSIKEHSILCHFLSGLSLRCISNKIALERELQYFCIYTVINQCNKSDQYEIVISFLTCMFYGNKWIRIIHDTRDDLQNISEYISWSHHQASAFLCCIKCMKKKFPTSVPLLWSVAFQSPTFVF